MALPAGNFSHPNPGRLRVIFGGKWWVNQGDIGLGASGFSLILRAYAGSGDDRLTSLLGSSGVASAVLESYYPGGYAVVPVGMEYVSHSLGVGTICAYNLTVACHLLPAA